MSLTNPNTVVTEQRLSEFYQGILPYLGGMPEMLANKFSKGDLYSTDEKMIGQWVDGKPLYQKTITTTNFYDDNVERHSVSLGDISGLNVDIAYISNICLIAEAGAQLILTESSYINDGMYFYLSINNKSFIQMITKNMWWDRGDSTKTLTAHITIQYTKTTDSAISIGSDTDYSTEEKIVGTWIDGSPVYQKTVVMTMPTATSQRDGAYWKGDTSVDITSLNISQLVNLFAMSSYPTTCNLIPYFGYANDAEETQYAKMNAIMCWSNKSTISIRRFYPSSVNPDAGADVYVTIQYTKTT